MCVCVYIQLGECVLRTCMSSNVLKSGYVGISVDVLTEDAPEKAGVTQTIMPELQGQMWSANSFFKISILPWLKESRQEQLVLMVYTVSQNSSLEPAHSFHNVHFCYYSYPVQYQKSVPSLFPKYSDINSCGAGRSAGDAEQGVWSASVPQRMRKAHSHKHTFPGTGGFCL